MPFSLADLIPMSLALRDVGLGLIELAFPESRPSLEGGYDLAVRSVKCVTAGEESAGAGPSSATWSYLFNKVRLYILLLFCHFNRFFPLFRSLDFCGNSTRGTRDGNFALPTTGSAATLRYP